MGNQSLNFCECFILFLVLLSCNKPKDTEPGLTGKWYEDSIQVKQSINSYVTVYRFTSKTDYWDYRADNKLYRFSNNGYDTIAYSVATDANGQRYVQYSPNSTDSIKILTDHLLVFIDPQGSASKLFFSK